MDGGDGGDGEREVQGLLLRHCRMLSRLIRGACCYIAASRLRPTSGSDDCSCVCIHIGVGDGGQTTHIICHDLRQSSRFRPIVPPG